MAPATASYGGRFFIRGSATDCSAVCSRCSSSPRWNSPWPSRSDGCRAATHIASRCVDATQREAMCVAALQPSDRLGQGEFHRGDDEQREQTAEQSVAEPRIKKRPPYEAVAGANHLHDRNLLGTGLD